MNPSPPLVLPHGDTVAVELTARIRSGDEQALRRLLDQRPELATARMLGRDGSGWRTPLHAATDWPGFFPHGPAIVALLFAAGADPNADTDGQRPETPLHWAASSDDVEVAVVLIDGGADLETPGGSIGTPLDNAVGYECWQVARLLVARGAAVAKLWQAAALGPADRVEHLLGQRTHTSDELSQGLWHACAGGQLRIAEYLVARGADPAFVPDYDARTVLDAARSFGTGRAALISWLEQQDAFATGRS